MFGRRTKRALETGQPSRTSQEGNVGAETETSPVTTMTLDLAPTDMPGADTGDGSGLAQIEAEFTISDADLALLDLASIAFDQQTNRLSAIDSTLANHRAELQDFMSRLDAAWSERTGTPVELQPFYMIPERCWEGEHQQVLVEVLGLAPAQPWNVLALAGNAATAAAIGVGNHPGAKALDHRAMATTLITEAVDTMHKTFERATFAADTVDTSALDAARSQAAADIKAIARRMAGTIVGTDAVDHARATFFND